MLIATDPRKESTRWASFMTFVGGLGFLSVIIDDTTRSYLQQHIIDASALDSILSMLANICSFIEKTGLPYGFLLFAFAYCNCFSPRLRASLAVLTLLPALLMFMLTSVYPELSLNYIWLTAWAAPYILTATVLLISHYYRESSPIARRGHLFVNIIGIIPLLCYLVTIYIARIFDITEAWKWNIPAVCAMFVAFGYFSIKHDIFGIKLHVDRSRFDTAMRAVTSGTVLLNHAIKNEAGKIHMLLDRIQATAGKQTDIAWEIQLIQASTNNLLQLAQRFHNQSQAIVLKESTSALLDITRELLSGMQTLLDNKGVTVLTDIPAGTRITCDPFHLKETLANILMNVADSIANEGIIRLRLNESQKYMTLSVQDDGHGIAKQHLPHVITPFFSTKNRPDNYGLGLSYCYNVMQKHGGSLDIHSVAEAGTTVFLHFPSKRFQH